MRRIMIEVDCGRKRCKACDCLADFEYLARREQFTAALERDAKNRPLRCEACLAAENEADKMRFEVKMPPVPELFPWAGKVSP